MLQKKSSPQFFSSKHKIGAFLLLAISLITILNDRYNGLGNLFTASVLESPAPFDGTVFPVDKVPNWLVWKGDNHKDGYSSISSNALMPLPIYDINQLQTPEESLVWGNKDHDVIRNAQLTYSVVYLGNYNLDHKENAGSHLAVDIRMPAGTPIKSIANGVVVKVSMTEEGFGHHVVIKHPDAPDPDNPSQKTVLYSGYNHMSDIVVKEGDVVKKGQIIGSSGATGTATTPHLHFQIDKESAPWHPYWPFTWAETQEAGLSFFEAVNAGLGLEQAKQHTVNPMVYLQKHLSGGAIVPQTPPPVVTPVDPVTPSPSIPTESQIGEGVAEEQVIEKPIVTETLIVEPEVFIAEGQTSFFSDVPVTHPNYKAISFLHEHGAITGYPDQTFQPERAVNRVEALQMLMLAFDIEKKAPTTLPFTDTDEAAWYADTLATAFQKAIVRGYEDGTFQPARIVNTAEYMKMLFETNDITPSFKIDENPYADVPADVWYAGYAYLTNKQNLIDAINNQLNADEGMTRGKVAESIYRMKFLLDNNMISYPK